MTYSLDLRKQALKYIKTVGTRKEASVIFSVTTRTLSNWISRERLQILAPNKRCSSPTKIDNHKLKQYLQKYPDVYLREIAQELSVTIPAIFYACKCLKLTLKKRSCSTKKEMKKTTRVSRNTKKYSHEKSCLCR